MIRSGVRIAGISRLLIRNKLILLHHRKMELKLQTSFDQHSKLIVEAYNGRQDFGPDTSCFAPINFQATAN
jgi:hypothetical protein